jgi:hypothetical protein
MTGAGLQGCLEWLGWSNHALAGRLGCDEKVVRRWLAGEAEIPVQVADWISDLSRHVASKPPPANWKRHGR